MGEQARTAYAKQARSWPPRPRARRRHPRGRERHHRRARPLRRGAAGARRALRRRTSRPWSPSWSTASYAARRSSRSRCTRRPAAARRWSSAADGSWRRETVRRRARRRGATCRRCCRSTPTARSWRRGRHRRAVLLLPRAGRRAAREGRALARAPRRDHRLLHARRPASATRRRAAHVATCSARCIPGAAGILMSRLHAPGVLVAVDATRVDLPAGAGQPGVVALRHAHLPPGLRAGDTLYMSGFASLDMRDAAGHAPRRPAPQAEATYGAIAETLAAVGATPGRPAVHGRVRDARRPAGLPRRRRRAARDPVARRTRRRPAWSAAACCATSSCSRSCPPP